MPHRVCASDITPYGAVVKPALIIKAAIALVAIWAVFATISHFANERKATADRFISIYQDSPLATDGERDTAARRDSLNELANVFNRMDFEAREDLRRLGDDRQFFEALSTSEQELWLDLTIEKSFAKLMQALDAMPEDKRQAFIEQAIGEWEKAQASGDLATLQELDPDMIDKIVEEGLGAYYQHASAETKMALAPLMEITNETVQGIRGRPLNGSNF